MPKIIAWQCPHTKELFADKKLYQTHLRKLGRERQYERRQQALKDAKLKVFSDIRNTVLDFKDLRTAILNKQEVFIRNGRDREWGGHRSNPDLRLVDIELVDMRFSYHVSNTHSCPFNGVTNWGGNVKLKDGTPAPRSYPGWKGNLWIALSHEPAFFGSEIFEGTGIHTGTGGATGNVKGYTNTYCLQWDVKLFLDDWSGLSKQLTWEQLKTI